MRTTLEKWSPLKEQGWKRGLACGLSGIFLPQLKLFFLVEGVSLQPFAQRLYYLRSKPPANLHYSPKGSFIRLRTLLPFLLLAPTTPSGLHFPVIPRETSQSTLVLFYIPDTHITSLLLSSQVKIIFDSLR